MDVFMGIVFAICIMLALGVIRVTLELVRMRRYMRVQNEMRERIRDYCDTLPYDGTLPVVAVERLVNYIVHPDPSLDVSSIVNQERLNQLTTIGSANN